MNEDIKKFVAVVGTAAMMFLVGEHAYNQEKSLFSRLKRSLR